MRDLQAEMLAAVLGGDGLPGVARLASAEVGGPVAIVLPARGLTGGSRGEPEQRLMAYVSSRLAGERAAPPAQVQEELEIRAGEEPIGAVLALSPNGSAPAAGLRLDRGEAMRAAAMAALAEVAAADARDELVHDLRGTLLEELRANRVGTEEAIRRASRLGCRIEHGAIALAAAVRSAKPRYVAALIASEWSGTLAEPLADDRVLALLPAGPAGAADAEDAARRIAGRLRSHGPAAASAFCPDPADLHRALGEAELALDVVAQDERLADQLANGMADGVYRLLFRALASNRDEVTSFYEDTVAPLVAHDREYRTDLLETIEAYLANDCNMNATAREVFAHRHTVSHRLQRVRELTGLDPAASDDRERLGLGIKAFRILAPTLER